MNIETLDLAVSRHLQKKFELGLFENPYVDEGKVFEVFETADQRSLAREIARQSMVLLKNDGMLPLSKQIGTLAVIGPNADSVRAMLGDYSYEATKELVAFQAPADSAFIKIDAANIAEHEVKVISVSNGLRQIVSPATRILHAKGCDNLSANTSGFDEALQAARQADAVILVLGDISGLVPTSTTGETRDSASLQLPGVQEDLAKAILATGKPVAAVLINGRPYAIPFLDEKANAILEAWIPGEEGGIAIAETLFGEYNPGGKLPITFPRHVGQIPIVYNHKPSGMKSHWYGDYVSEKATPLYAFGHGLSYTTFSYEELSVQQKQVSGGETVDISLKVTNTGNVRGDEVVQLYIRDEYASSPRPMKELKGYARVSLESGASKTVTFHLPVDQLAFYNADRQLVLEPGRVFIMLGSSSDDIRLMDEIEIVGKGSLPVKERVFVCPVDVR